VEKAMNTGTNPNGIMFNRRRQYLAKADIIAGQSITATEVSSSTAE
jgi:hypothetical protein